MTTADRGKLFRLAFVPAAGPHGQAAKISGGDFLHREEAEASLQWFRWGMLRDSHTSEEERAVLAGRFEIVELIN